MCFHIGLCVPTQLVTDVYVGGLVNGEGNQSLVLNEGDTLTLKWFQAGPHGRGLWCWNPPLHLRKPWLPRAAGWDLPELCFTSGVPQHLGSVWHSMLVCLCVSTFCLSAFLSVCLPACLSFRQPYHTCVSVYLSACQSACLSNTYSPSTCFCLSPWMFVCISQKRNIARV